MAEQVVRGLRSDMLLLQGSVCIRHLGEAINYGWYGTCFPPLSAALPLRSVSDEGILGGRRKLSDGVPGN